MDGNTMSNNKKKIMALSLVIVFIVSMIMTGCGDNAEKAANKDNTTSRKASEQSADQSAQQAEESADKEDSQKTEEKSDRNIKKTASEGTDDDEGVWQMDGRKAIPVDAKAYYKTWDEMVDCGWVDQTLLGYPSNGDKSYPVYLYHMVPGSDYVDAHYKVQEGEIYDRPKILVTSGFHGSEKAAPTFLRNLIHDMMTDPELASIAGRYEWDIIPLVNPWGYSHSLLKNGEVTNGVVYDNFNGYEVVTNEKDKYKQGVRLNADEQDCNRDWYDGRGGFPSEEAKLVRDILVDGDYDMVLDMHQTKNTTACGFISVGKKPEGMKQSTYDDNCAKVYTAANQAGMETDRLISSYYSMDTIKQTTYPWAGTDEATFRNYASGFTADGSRNIDLKNPPKYSLCLEISLYCIDYSGDESNVSYNSAANTYGNTFIHHFAAHLDDLL